MRTNVPDPSKMVFAIDKGKWKIESEMMNIKSKLKDGKVKL